MDTLCGVLIATATLLVLLAVVGHGLWVLLASMIRAAFPQGRLHCPACTNAFVPGEKHCTSCGFTFSEKTTSLEQDLDSTARQIKRWSKWESIPPEHLDKLRGLLHEQRDHLKSRGREFTPLLEGAPKKSTDAARPATELPGSAVEQAKPELESPTSAADAREVEDFVPVPVPIPVADDEVSVVDEEALEEPADTVDSTSARPTMGSLAAAFMEERNIRWGELISGMLIVGSAVGLVISLWSSLDDIPYFPALLFLLVTGGLHAAGKYTLSRWKLESTSRGLLVISTLLIPLNFVGAISLSHNNPAVSLPLYAAAVGIGVVAFSAIAVSSSRTLMLSQNWLLVLAVMGPSIGQLLMSRLATPGMNTGDTLLLAGIPVASHLAAIAMYTWIASRWSHWTERRTHQTLLILGMACFSLVVSLGLLVTRATPIAGAVAALSPLLSLVAISVVAIGTLIHARLAETQLHGLRTAGTSVLFFGAAMMVAALVSAWPRPDLLIAVAVINFVALTAFAVAARVPHLHVPAVISAAFAIDLGMLTSSGRLALSADSTLLLHALLSGVSAANLVAAALLTGAAAKVILVRQHRVAYRFYLLTVLILSGLSALVATYAGYAPAGGDHVWLTPVLGINAVLWSVAACRSRRSDIASVSSVIWLVACHHGLSRNVVYRDALAEWSLSPDMPDVVALLFHASTVAVLALLLHFRRQRQLSTPASRPAGVEQALSYSAMLTSALTIPAALNSSSAALVEHAGYLGWIAGTWFTVAVVLSNPRVAIAAQSATTVSLSFLTTAYCRSREWWSYDAPQFYQYQLAVAAATAIAWNLVRIAIRPSEITGDIGAHAGGDSLRQRLSACLQSQVVEWALLLIATIGLCVMTFVGHLAWSTNLASAPPIDSLPLWWCIVLGAFCVGELIAFLQVSRFSSNQLVTLVGVAGITMAYRALSDHSWLQYLDIESVRNCHGPITWLIVLLTGTGLMMRAASAPHHVLAAGLLTVSLTVPFLIASFWLDAWAALLWGFVGYTAIAAAGHKWSNELQQLPRLLRIGHLNLKRWGLEGGWHLAFVAGGLVAIVLFGHVRLEQLLLWDGQSSELTWGLSLDALEMSGPMLAFAVILLLNAIATRGMSSTIAMAWSLQSTVFFVCSLFLVGRFELHDSMPAFLQVMQCSALALATGALCCHACARIVERTQESADPDRVNWLQLPMSVTQWNMATLCYAVVLAAAQFAIISHPASPSVGLLQCGTITGLVTSVFVLSSCWLACRRDPVLVSHVCGISIWSVVLFVAARGSLLSEEPAWFGYELLEVGFVIAATVGTAATIVLTYLATKSSALESHQVKLLSAGTNWCIASGLVAILLGMKGFPSEDHAAILSVITVAAMSANAFALGLSQRSVPFAAVSIVLSGIAAGLFELAPLRGMRLENQQALELAQAIGCGALLVTGLWLAVDVWSCRVRNTLMLPVLPRGSVYTYFWLPVLLISVWLTAQSLVSRLVFQQADFESCTAYGYLLVALLAFNVVARLWVTGARYILAGMWLVGWQAGMLMVEHRGDLGHDLISELNWLIAVFASVLAVLVTSGNWIGTRLERLIESGRSYAESGNFLIAAHSFLTMLAILAGLYGCTHFSDTSARIAVAAAAGISVLAPLSLAHRLAISWLQCACLVVLGIVATEIGWGILPLQASHSYLLRSIRSMTVLGAISGMYGLLLVRIAPPNSLWRQSVHRATAILGALTLAALLNVLIGEYRWFTPGVGAPVTELHAAWTAVVLVGLAAALLSLAVLPDRDPLALSMRGRMVYVYAAEVIISLLFLHIYLTVPELFTGRLRKYWPFIVMAIAFAGAGVGEWLSRLKLRVLSEPLQRTAAFLPLIPVLALWVTNSFGILSAILFLAGMLYLALCMLRTSFAFGLAAALAGNAALWVALHDQGFAMLIRPQLWLIPPALSVLTAAQLNRHRLGEAQLTSIRYLAVTTIYVSSTGEMFVHGVGESRWLPLVLAGLSVLGVLAGILLQVRAYLYLGSSFLLLSLVSMVWHAAQSLNHVWPWWAFGIALGLAVLTLFGLFEKKRNELQQVVEGLKSWDK